MGRHRLFDEKEALEAARAHLRRGRSHIVAPSHQFPEQRQRRPARRVLTSAVLVLQNVFPRKATRDGRGRSQGVFTRKCAPDVGVLMRARLGIILYHRSPRTGHLPRVWLNTDPLQR